MGALDEILPRTLLDVFSIYSTLFAILVLNAIALYWTLIPSFFLLIIFFFVVNVYMKTAQAVKRLEGTSRCFGIVFFKIIFTRSLIHPSNHDKWLSSKESGVRYGDVIAQWYCNDPISRRRAETHTGVRSTSGQLWNYCELKTTTYLFFFSA